MKTNIPALLFLCATLSQLPAAAPGDSRTNRPYAGMRAVRAPAFVPPPPPQPLFATNPPAPGTPPVPGPIRLPSNLSREIQLSNDTAAATYGLTKVSWKSDLTAERPIAISTPDNRTIYCRPAFLALQNRHNGQSIMLGAVTNRVGEIIASDMVRWTNILDSGPNVSIEYRYLHNGRGMEQNVLLLESPAIPEGWTNSDVSIDFWTEWFDSVPTAIETRALTLRDASNSLPAIQADDQQISFGSISKLVAGGRAFTLGEESNSLRVAKSWVVVTNGSIHTFLVESLDLAAAASRLQALPPTSRHASLGRPKSSRSALLQAAAERSAAGQAALDLNLESSGRVREVPIPNRDSGFNSSKFAASATSSKFNGSTFNSSVFRVPSSPALDFRPQTLDAGRAPAFVIDFTLLNAVPLPANAVAWWPAGGPPTGADDATANHNDGTLLNDATYGPGEVGQAFDLQDTAHVRVPSSPSLTLTNAMTVEAWIFPTQESWYHSIVSKWDVTWDDNQRSFDFCINYHDNLLRFLVTHTGLDEDGVYVLSSNSIPTDTWTHVAGTYDGTALKVYINGVLDGSGAYTNGIFPGTNDLSVSGYVGGGSPGDIFSEFFGLIDEPTLYNRALSTNEILAIYNAGPAGKYNPNCVAPSTNAVGWWPGDGKGNDLARTNTGTLYNGPTYPAGMVAQSFAFAFDSEAHLRIPASPSFALTNALTVEAWIFPTTENWWHSIISKWDVLDLEDYSFDFAINWGDNLLRLLVTPTGLNDGGVYVLSSNAIPLNTWTHVAGTYDGSNLKVYLNGVLDGSSVYSSGIFPGTNDLAVSGYTGGASPGAVFSPFIGQIDEATLYNRALSGVEIAAIYSAGCAGKCKVDTDGDGLSDLQEFFLGTNPANSDTDGDGVEDWTEFVQGRNPTVGGSVTDTNHVIQLQVYTPLH